MTDSSLRQLEKAGVNPAEVSTDINLMYVLSDIQETLCLRVEENLKKAGAFRFNDKQNIITIKRAAGNMRRFADEALKYDAACAFGDDSDELLSVIMNHITSKRNGSKK
jgi:hypothetical protein